MSKKQYNQVFLESYTKEFPFLTKSRKGENFSFCTVCCCDISVSHGGLNDLKVHVRSKKHIALFQSKEKCNNIGNFFKNCDDHKVINAECLFTAFIAEHNLPVAVADHAGPLFRKMFPDSEIAKKYGSGRTKTTAIIDKMAKTCSADLTQMLQDVPFTIATDGSNDSDSKLFPVVICYYNSSVREIKHSLLNVPNLIGDATGHNIGNLILSSLEKKGLLIKNCIGFSADNAPVMIGSKAGAASVLLNENPEILIVGCTCHLINLAAEKGANALPVDVDQILVDIFYYLHRSSKRKDRLKEIQVLYDTEQQKILKHVCTRWLSLGRSLRRLIEQWDPVLSFFKDEVQDKNIKVSDSLKSYSIPLLKKLESASESYPGSEIKPGVKRIVPFSPDNSNKKKKSESGALKVPQNNGDKSSNSISSKLNREEKIFMFLSSDVNKAYCLFLDFIIPTFDDKNITLQSASPKIHVLKPLLLDLFKNLLTKFVKPSVIKKYPLLKVVYSEKKNQKDDADVVIGSAALKIVNTLKEDQKATFYMHVKSYYIKACNYMIYKFPFNSKFLDHAQVADIVNIPEKKFSDIAYFVQKCPAYLHLKDGVDIDKETDRLQNEFCNFQLEDLPESILNESRIDRQWVLVGDMKGSDGSLKYKRLSRVMLSILSLPASNAECERVFSMVKKTRTNFRKSLSDSSLESFLIIKSHMQRACYEQNFSKTFLKEAKSATYSHLKKCSNDKDGNFSDPE